MPYRIEFFNERIKAEVLGWPAGIAASFTVIASRMVEHGFIKKTQATPQAELRIARKRLKEVQGG